MSESQPLYFWVYLSTILTQALSIMSWLEEAAKALRFPHTHVEETKVQCCIYEEKLQLAVDINFSTGFTHNNYLNHKVTPWTMIHSRNGTSIYNFYVYKVC